MLVQLAPPLVVPCAWSRRSFRRRGSYLVRFPGRSVWLSASRSRSRHTFASP